MVEGVAFITSMLPKHFLRLCVHLQVPGFHSFHLSVIPSYTVHRGQGRVGQLYFFSGRSRNFAFLDKVMEKSGWFDVLSNMMCIFIAMAIFWELFYASKYFYF